MNAKIPPGLKILQSTGTTRDGRPKDSGGRTIQPPPPFEKGTPEPPKHLDEVGLEYWHEVVPLLARAGLLRMVDKHAIAEMCALYSALRTAETNRRKAQIPEDEMKWLGYELRYHTELRHHQTMMGLVPTAEGVYTDRPTIDDNPFALQPDMRWSPDPNGTSPTGLAGQE